MGTNAQTLLNEFATLVALLGGVVRLHSDHLMSGTFSLGFEDVEKSAPRGIHDGFRQMMVLDHIADSQVFNRDVMVPLGVLFGRLEVEITTLPRNLQMRFRHVLRRLPATVTPLLAATQSTLLASERLLRGSIIAGVLDRMTIGISQEGFQADINANVRMSTSREKMFGLWLGLADNQRVPVVISTQNKMCCFRSTLKRAMQFDLEGFAQLSRNMKMLSVFIQPDIAAAAILAEVDRMPAIGTLETGKAHVHGKFFAGKEAFEGLGEAVCKHLYRRGWDLLSPTSFELGREVILRGKCPLVLILRFHGLKHLIVQDARRLQALHEQVDLLLIGIQAIFKRPHHPTYSTLGLRCQRAQFIPMPEGRGPLAPVLVGARL